MLVIQKGKLGPEGRLVAGNRDIYALREGHAALALQHWCGAERVPTHPLALFLYRDLAFDLDAPDTGAWVRRFREEFGYEDAHGTPTDDYRTLFTEEGAEAYAPADDWLEAYDPPADEPATGDDRNQTSDDDPA